jgi:hypothetical protein
VLLGTATFTDASLFSTGIEVDVLVEPETFFVFNLHTWPLEDFVHTKVRVLIFADLPICDLRHFWPLEIVNCEADALLG